MGWADWLIGWLLLVVQAGASAWAGHGVRRRLVPAWRGSVAVVAAAVSAVAVLVGVAEALGSLGLLQRWVLPVVLSAVAWVLDPDRAPWAGAGAGSPEPPVEEGAPAFQDASPGPHAFEGRRARHAAIVVVAVVAAGWIERVVAVYRSGHTDGDSLMYHLPFAARFVQSGWTTAADPVGPDAWVAFYPANVELVQATMILPFRSDVLVPLGNLGWLALALGAAWCIGARAGRAASGMALCAAVVGAPVMVATQGGTARVDIAAIALLLAAVALVMQEPRSAGSCVVAGLALGLVIGAKFVVLPTAGLLLVAVAVALWRRHGTRPAAAWLVAAAGAGGYWYVRNWFTTGNPLPALDMTLGPLGFRSLPAERLAVLDDTSLADKVALPGFWPNIGYPLLDHMVGSIVITAALVSAAVATAVLVLRQRPWGLRHAVVLAAVGGCLAYPFVPNTAPVGNTTDNPLAATIVVLNARYLLPSLVVLVCLLPIAFAGRFRRAGAVALAAMVAAVVYQWFDGLAFDAEWPTGPADTAIAVAVVAAVALTALVGAAVPGARRLAGGGRTTWAVGARAVAGAGLVGALIVTAAQAAGRSDLHGYARLEPTMTQLWRAVDGTHGERIALVVDWVQFAHLGDDLDKTVDYVGLPEGRNLTRPPRDCDELEAALSRADYDIVVVQQPLFGSAGSMTGSATALADCLLAGDRAELVLRNRAGAVFTL